MYTAFPSLLVLGVGDDFSSIKMDFRSVLYAFFNLVSEGLSHIFVPQNLANIFAFEPLFLVFAYDDVDVFSFRDSWVLKFTPNFDSHKKSILSLYFSIVKISPLLVLRWATASFN